MSNQKLSKSIVHVMVKVENLEKSKMFYSLLFETDPIVDEENICEFKINKHTIMGLVTDNLIDGILDKELVSSSTMNKKGFVEIYIETKDAEKYHQKALQLGCLEVSPFSERSWGHRVGYSQTHDSTILAFAESIDEN